MADTHDDTKSVPGTLHSKRSQCQRRVYSAATLLRHGNRVIRRVAGPLTSSSGPIATAVWGVARKPVPRACITHGSGKEGKFIHVVMEMETL